VNASASAAANVVGPWRLWSSFRAWLSSVWRRCFRFQRELPEENRLGPYTLLEKLGEGGMGSVYLARHAMLRRLTAIKLLLPERALDTGLARFEREAQVTSSLAHPNIVSIYDYGRTVDGVRYYAMEYVDGVSLEDLVRADGPQPAARVIHILLQLASALAEAHRAGLVHRDIKPANIALSSNCRHHADLVKVLDFGLVKSNDGEDASVTLSNAITGTPAYLAPEMIVNPKQADARVDVYGLGAVGYFMLTGMVVFDAASPLELCAHHLYTSPTPPSERTRAPIPEALERLILSCLEKDPEKRPSELLQGFTALSQAHPWSSEQAATWWTSFRPQSGTPAQRSVPGASFSLADSAQACLAVTSSRGRARQSLPRVAARTAVADRPERGPR
jgi:eukaryotic-like serine/threonine-protein kinase